MAQIAPSVVPQAGKLRGAGSRPAVDPTLEAAVLRLVGPLWTNRWRRNRHPRSGGPAGPGVRALGAGHGGPEGPGVRAFAASRPGGPAGPEGTRG